MKRLTYWTLINICLISLLLAAPTGAAISPCNQMTGSVMPDGSGLTLVVDDPRPDVNQWIYMYSVEPPNTITHFNISNGIARWCEGYYLETGFYNGRVVHVLFDPARGWQLGQSSNSDWALNSLMEANGVVSVEAVSRAYFSTYDPIKGYWASLEENEGGYYIPLLANKDGVVAFFVNMFDPKEVQFYIYDYTLTTPGISGWRRGSQYPANTADITQASVVVDGKLWWGYDPVSQVWQSGIVTQAKAFIYANPTQGTPPLWVWFWDLSLGAQAKQWNFGDGSPVVDGRSCGHNYPNKGIYTVNQFVVGFPGGFFDETTKTIYVGVTPTPAGMFYVIPNREGGGATIYLE